MNQWNYSYINGVNSSVHAGGDLHPLGAASGCRDPASVLVACLTCLPGERTDVSLKYLPGLTELLQLHSVITSSAISGFVNFP